MYCGHMCGARAPQRLRDQARAGRTLRPTRFVVCTSDARARLLPRLLRRGEGERSSVGAVKLGANFLPRQSFHTASTEVRHAAFDLSRPSLFMIGSRMVFEAFQQKAGKLGPVVGWQLRCLFVQIENGSAHG